MRRTLTVMLLILGIGVIVVSGLEPQGQAQTAGSPFLGGTPRAMNFQPVNMKNMVGGANTTQMLYKPKTPTPLGLGNIFPKVPQISFPPKFSSSPQIDPRKNPLQPNLPKGRYVLNPTPPGPKSKTIWDFPYNPLKKTQQ
jgi:hypothetical protein